MSVLDEIEPLTKREAREARATTIKSLIKWGQILDEGMPLLSKTGREVNIWGNLDEAEAGVLADCLIDMGRRWAVAAQIVRGIVRTYSWLEVGMITLPRFKQTISYYLREGFALSFRVGLGRR